MKSRLSRRALTATVAGSFALVFVAACGSDATLVDGDGADTASNDSAASVTVTPEDGTADAPVSTEIEFEVEDGDFVELSLHSAAGDVVEGEMREDESTWVPDAPLEFDTEYTTEVTAVDDEDISVTAEAKFTTMPDPPNRMDAYLWNGNEYEYGQAMPIMLDFPRDFEVPEDRRAEVESRLFVESDPPQEGVWHWFSGNHLEYRPEHFWEPGTEITVRFGLGGLPLGDDLYGAQDIASTITISDTERSIEVDDDAKEMVAKENGETVDSMDVSLGKSETPSYSGTMIVMEKEEETVFDTTENCDGEEDEEEGCYVTDIDWAMRLTWSGQYIHAADWSVDDQGVRNVSHGCVNVAPDEAEWIYGFARLGDPVIVNGTGTDLPYGDGFTAYDLSWDDFQAGSALADDGTDGE